MSVESFWKGPIMTKHLVACFAALLVLAFSGPLRAQEPEGVREAKQIQLMLSVVNAEIKADLDQIRVLQEAIRDNARTTLQSQWNSPDPVSFEDKVAEQRRAIQREAALGARIEAILARSAALDAKKQPLIERLMALDTASPAAAK